MTNLKLLVIFGLIISCTTMKNLRRPGYGSRGRINHYHINNEACDGKKISCNKNDMYRSITGTCNNLKYPYLGAANSLMARFFDPEYYDCKEVPKGGYAESNEIQQHKPLKSFNSSPGCNGANQSLPNVREVSNTFHPDVDIPRNHYSLMIMQFGQFLDHDMALSPEVEVEEECCTHPDTEDCFPIYIPRQDPFYSTRSLRPTCQEFTRSDAFCPERRKNAHREQYSMVTSFVDGSQIYSSNERDARTIRAPNGKLATNSRYSREILPEVNGKLMAGDLRALDMPGLAAIQTLFVREHNRIASILQSEEIFSDEQIYQRARRIVIAEYQNIVFNEYLPLILGSKSVNNYKLNVDKETEYDENEDPSLVNSFATAAYRFGHSLIQGIVNMADVNDPESIVRLYQLRDNFFNMDNYVRDDGMGMEQILAGLTGQKAQSMDRFVTKDVTNFLFMEFGEDTGHHKKRDFGADLVSRNLQRGRDHGLPGYNKYRQLCKLRALPSFKSSKSPSEMSAKNWKILRELYQHEDDIDLFVGGLSEFPLHGALTGPTFNCIKSIMFGRVMRGDRFFYTHGNQAGSFNSRQLTQLRKRTLRDILCENTELKKARSSVFLLHGGDMIDCKETNTLDMRLFF